RLQPQGRRSSEAALLVVRGPRLDAFARLLRLRRAASTDGVQRVADPFTGLAELQGRRTRVGVRARVDVRVRAGLVRARRFDDVRVLARDEVHKADDGELLGVAL